MNGTFNVSDCTVSYLWGITKIGTGVGEAEWAFRINFDVTREELDFPHLDLVFGGLDTFAAVTLVCLTLQPF